MFRKALMVCLLAWLVPGGGHFLLKKWGRGFLFLVAICVLFFMGVSMQGQLFGWTPGFFGFLKFFANLSLGLLYFLGTAMGWGVGNIHAYSYEYGNTYLYTAGLLNMLLVLDSFDIVAGRRT